MTRHLALALTVVLLVPEPAAGTAWLIPPVDGPIAARFEQPDGRWGPGHRGIDLAVPAGTSVRAAGAGTVTFAGTVAGTKAVTIDHGGGLETTYTDLGSVLVEAGQAVTEGHWIGTTAVTHRATGTAGLHFGVIVDGTYADPELFLGPLDISDAIYLAPHVWAPPDNLPAAFRHPFLSASAIEPCADRQAIAHVPPPPNDNIAVLIAGIGSKTRGGVSAAIHERGSDLLGYPARATYRFSYRSSADDDLHVDYDRTDTFGDLRTAAGRLSKMLERVARRHPNRAVDLIAHSQGGIVARTYLQLAARSWDRRLPRIEHLVTFATPHEGAPLGAAGEALEGSATGRAALELVSRWSRHSGPIPDPHSVAVEQLAPGSGLLDRLQHEAVLYGTRVLSLAIPNDVVVPANAATWDNYPSRVVGPAGLNGHDAIVSSAEARGVAHAFLRDARPTCRGGWDLWGPRIGAGIGLLERGAAWLAGRALP